MPIAMSRLALPLLVLLAVRTAFAAGPVDDRNPLFRYLTAGGATLVAYTPSALDPRNPDNQAALKTSSIRADLEALRPAFDGLVLYGYHEATTPRIMATAKRLGFKAVILGVWQPKSAAELDGVADLANRHHADVAVGVIVGNEGLTFGRYEPEDLTIAAERLRAALPQDVPITTTEPLHKSRSPEVLAFGDFMLPNIHPVFDASDLSAEKAAAWTRRQAADLARRSGKPVVVKETGFPHAGKPAYTPASQRAFWETYVAPGLVEAAGPRWWMSYAVAFEAFDLPWKSEASGLPIEKSWGLLSTDRTPYPAFGVWRELREQADAGERPSR